MGGWNAGALLWPGLLRPSEALRAGRAALGPACLAARILLTHQVLGKSVNSSSVRHGAKGGAGGKLLLQRPPSPPTTPVEAAGPAGLLAIRLAIGLAIGCAYGGPVAEACGYAVGILLRAIRKSLITLNQDIPAFPAFVYRT